MRLHRFIHRHAVAPTVAIGAMALALACAPSVRPLSPGARFDGQPASSLVLTLAEPCSVLPGGAPMGRPDGVRSHALPAGRYRPVLEDGRGVFFESPAGLALTQPGLRGTHTRPGGIYVAREGRIAWQYLGDAGGISSRERLPLGCRFVIEPAGEAGSAQPDAAAARPEAPAVLPGGGDVDAADAGRSR